MSQVESYSILEKINEWKKEEGVNSETAYTELPPTNIPRPTKLIMDFDLDNINNEDKESRQTTNTTVPI